MALFVSYRGHSILSYVITTIKLIKLGSLILKIDYGIRLIVHNVIFLVVCQRVFLKFSAHADTHGLLKVIEKVRPKNVMFVHGTYHDMVFL